MKYLIALLSLSCWSVHIVKLGEFLYGNLPVNSSIALSANDACVLQLNKK